MSTSINFKNSLLAGGIVLCLALAARWGCRLVSWLRQLWGTPARVDTVAREALKPRQENPATVRQVITVLANPTPKASEIESKVAASSQTRTDQSSSTPLPGPDPKTEEGLKGLRDKMPALFDEFSETLPSQGVDAGIARVLEFYRKEKQMRQVGKPIISPLLIKYCYRGMNFTILDGGKALSFRSDGDKKKEDQQEECLKIFNECLADANDWQSLMQSMCADTLGFALANPVEGGKFKQYCANLNLDKWFLTRRDSSAFPHLELTLKRHADGSIDRVFFVIDRIVYDLFPSRQSADPIWSEVFCGHLEGEAYFENGEPILIIDREKTSLTEGGSGTRKATAKVREPGFEAVDYDTKD